MATVLTICGSFGRRSANRSVLDVVTARAHELGARVESFDRVRDIPPFDPDQQDAGPEVVAAMTAALLRADLVAIAAPEYAGAIAGQIKNAFDWQVGAAGVYRRPIVVFSAGSTGGEYARSMLTQTLLWHGGWVIGHLGVSAPRTKVDDRGVIVDTVTLLAIRQLVDDAIAMSADPHRCVEAAVSVAAGFGIVAGRVAAAE